MKKTFLQFMEQVTDIDCPFSSFNVVSYKTFIEVTFIVATSVNPTALGWLNTHLVNGRWFITAEADSVRIVVRFVDEDKD